MRKDRLRPLVMALGLVGALAGGLSVAFFGGRTEPASAYDRYVIEVTSEGFNPRTCRINRGDEIQFRNVGNVAVRVFKPQIGGLPPDPDITLEPGESSYPISYTAGTTDRYFTVDGHVVEVLTPPRSNTWQVSCAKEAPTPTPTATPQAPATPPLPAKCWGRGCAVGLNLAFDG